MRLSIDIKPDADITAGGSVLMIADKQSDVRFMFGDIPARQDVDQLDKLAAGALEIRGRLLRELATDEDR